MSEIDNPIGQRTPLSESHGFRQFERGPVEAQGINLELLNQWLSATTGRNIVDGTGLTNRQDVNGMSGKDGLEKVETELIVIVSAGKATEN